MQGLEELTLLSRIEKEVVFGNVKIKMRSLTLKEEEEILEKVSSNDGNNIVSKGLDYQKLVLSKAIIEVNGQKVTSDYLIKVFDELHRDIFISIWNLYFDNIEKEINQNLETIKKNSMNQVKK